MGKSGGTSSVTPKYDNQDKRQCKVVRKQKLRTERLRFSYDTPLQQAMLRAIRRWKQRQELT